MTFAGFFDIASRRVCDGYERAQLHLDGYQAFMEHMCPGTALAGQVPPPGTDPAACPKPIMGVYDDHDFGWNNGNRRRAAAVVSSRCKGTVQGSFRLSPAEPVCKSKSTYL